MGGGVWVLRRTWGRREWCLRFACGQFGIVRVDFGNLCLPVSGAFFKGSFFFGVIPLSEYVFPILQHVAGAGAFLQGFNTGPGFNTSATPGRIDETHRHFESLVKVTAKEESHG